MRFVSLASSSSGNSELISYKNTNILIDCGISRKRLVGELSVLGLTLSDIDAILVTHDHDDHILGLPAVLKTNNIELYFLREAFKKIITICENKGTKIDVEKLKIIHPINVQNPDDFRIIKDIKVYPIKGAHDVPSVFYKFELGDVKVAIVTDIGELNDYMIRSISDVSYLMLECNYDVDMMLETSVYPPKLKARIMGNTGHLSNMQCSEIIMKLANPVLKKVFLSHISKNTNTEEYALEFVTSYLKKNYNGKEKLPEIEVARRTERTVIIDD